MPDPRYSIWWTAPVAFVLTLIASICWALYFRYSHERKAVRAATADCGIVLVGMVNILGYVEDHRLAIPILIATWIGTYIAIRKKVLNA